jgi:hypothetical protein
MAGRRQIKKKQSSVLDVEETKQKEADRQKYSKKVKEYTHYRIGRKLSENVAPYTEQEINGQNLIIKSPAILRILTKWCEELWTKFDKENFFTERAEPVIL